MILFLDIDGVLNDHVHHQNGYCGTKLSCVKCFNRVIDAIPELNLVISSAWRYSILKGDVTLKGFELLLLTHGVKCQDRVIGYTEADGPIEEEPNHVSEKARWHEAGLKWRANQIKKWVQEHKPKDWLAVDDLELNLHPFNFHRTNDRTGLTEVDSDILILRLLEKR